jgi:transposase
MADEDRREGRNPDWYISQCVGVSERHVCRIRQRFVREGLASTIERKTRSDAGVPDKMDGKVEAQLVTLCCSEPPAGQQRWTLQLLVDELSRLKVVASVCRETVRKTLKKIALRDYATCGTPGGGGKGDESKPTVNATRSVPLARGHTGHVV